MRAHVRLKQRIKKTERSQCIRHGNTLVCVYKSNKPQLQWNCGFIA